MIKEQSNIRMDPRLKKRIQDYMKKFEKDTRVKISFAEAICSLVEKSLEREGIK